ncbi:TNF receptor-associated factor 6-like [Amblyomma americanum]
MEFPAEDVLKREVKCWNEEHGCQTVMAASAISKHFQRDCEHHTAPCPQCSAPVLCSSMCAHLRSACTAAVVTSAIDPDPEPSIAKDGAFLAPFVKALEGLKKQAGEMSACLEQLVTHVGSQGNRLNEISHGVNTFGDQLKLAMTNIQQSVTPNLRETVTENATNVSSTRLDALESTFKDELCNATRQSNENYSRIAATIDEVKEKSQKALDCIGTILRRDERRVAHTVFYVNGIKSLQEKALREGYAVYESEQVHLRGYCMAPGVTLESVGDSVRLRGKLCLKRCDTDDDVQWPFEHGIKLSLTHPTAESEIYIKVDPWRDFGWYRKPSESNNMSVSFSLRSLSLDELTRAGFVFEDQLRIKCEVLE